MYYFTIITNLFLSTNYTLLGGSTLQQSNKKDFHFQLSWTSLWQINLPSRNNQKTCFSSAFGMLNQPLAPSLPCSFSWFYSYLDYYSFSVSLAVSLPQGLAHLFLYTLFLEEFSHSLGLVITFMKISIIFISKSNHFPKL